MSDMTHNKRSESMKDERITIRLREEDKQKIKIWCIKNNMTLSELCMISINRYINNEEIKSIHYEEVFQSRS